MADKFKDSWVFDLDGTICIPDRNCGNAKTKYILAKPVQPVIDVMHNLYNNGYYIIINTARRMVTYNNDVIRVRMNIEEITRDWLENHEVPFHELRFGKPYSANYYVDDKSLSIEELLEKFGNE